MAVTFSAVAGAAVGHRLRDARKALSNSTRPVTLFSRGIDMKRFAFWLILMTSPAQAADHALILNDEEIKVLRQMLDVATKAQGLAVAKFAVYFDDKLANAPAVKEHKDDKPAEPPGDQNAPK